MDGQNRLIQHGDIISAKVIEANGLNMQHQKLPPNSPVKLEFDWHGQDEVVSGFLEDRPTADYIIVDDNVTIRVDPNDVTNWTYRSQITGIGETLFVSWMLLPIPPLLLAVAMRKRNRLKKIWCLGSAALAVVSGRRPDADRAATSLRAVQSAGSQR